jgi:AdoMet-dependent heme synthase
MLDIDLLMKRVLQRVEPRLIILTGGEPLLHLEGVQKCITYCAERSAELGLFSNLALITKSILTRLRSVPAVWLRTTINGSSAYTHESSYPPGSFKTTCDGILLARRENIQVRARMTVTSQNVHDVGATAKLASSLGVSELDLRPYAPIGQGPPDNLVLSVRQHIDVVRTAFSLDLPDLKVRLLPNWFEYAFTTESDGAAPCNCGKTYLYIDPLGVIRPCAGYRVNLGTIVADDIERVFRESPFLVQIRKETFGQYCEGCAVYARCRSTNCHLLNYEAYGSLSSVNPLCPLYRLDPRDPRAGRARALAIYQAREELPPVDVDSLSG